MRRSALLLVALALSATGPAAAQRALTVYSPTVTVPVIETYGWYGTRGRRPSGWYFQSAVSNCQDYSNFISNAAEECMRRHGYIYAPVARSARSVVHRSGRRRVVVRARG